MGAMGVLAASACAICSGRAITAWRRATFNPLVQMPIRGTNKPRRVIVLSWPRPQAVTFSSSLADALAAAMIWAIAPTALVTLGSSGGPVREPVHADGDERTHGCNRAR
jgi:hypothetical protein